MGDNWFLHWSSFTQFKPPWLSSSGWSLHVWLLVCETDSCDQHVVTQNNVLLSQSLIQSFRGLLGVLLILSVTCHGLPQPMRLLSCCTDSFVFITWCNVIKGFLISADSLRVWQSNANLLASFPSAFTHMTWSSSLDGVCCMHVSSVALPSVSPLPVWLKR